MSIDKVVIVKKRTDLEDLLRRYLTPSQVKFHLESRGNSYDFYNDVHKTYHQCLQSAVLSIPKTLRLQILDKDDLSSYQFSNKDIVVTVGDAGMLVNVAKYIGEQPVISLNHDEVRYDPVLSTCNIGNFKNILNLAMKGETEIESLTMAEAALDDGQMIYALNDFFIGRKTHTSAKYKIECGSENELQSSDGIVISTGTGSTGWMTSIITGANAIANSEPVLNDDVPFDRDANYLLFAVINPFISKITKANIVYGRIQQNSPLKVTSNMPENGVIFSDGVESDYLDFNSGRYAIISPSEKKVNLVRDCDSI
jgi:hypothetical protein